MNINCLIFVCSHEMSGSLDHFLFHILLPFLFVDFLHFVSLHSWPPMPLPPSSSSLSSSSVFLRQQGQKAINYKAFIRYLVQVVNEYVYFLFLSFCLPSNLMKWKITHLRAQASDKNQITSINIKCIKCNRFTITNKNMKANQTNKK